MNEQVDKIIDDQCRRYAYKRQKVEDAIRRIENHDWSEFQGELSYMTWKYDHELLASIACRLIREVM